MKPTQKDFERARECVLHLYSEQNHKVCEKCVVGVAQLIAQVREETKEEDAKIAEAKELFLVTHPAWSQSKEDLMKSIAAAIRGAIEKGLVNPKEM